MSRRLSAEERRALSELNRILSETPQRSSEEELCHDMKNIGGRVRFCHFWDEHYSMVQLILHSLRSGYRNHPGCA